MKSSNHMLGITKYVVYYQMMPQSGSIFFATVYLEIIMLNIKFLNNSPCINEYCLVCTQFALTTPFWAVNLRIDGARATDEAAAAAATRILQNFEESYNQLFNNSHYIEWVKLKVFQLSPTSYVHQHIHQSRLLFPPAPMTIFKCNFHQLVKCVTEVTRN